jgi:hypothetical protein
MMRRLRLGKLRKLFRDRYGPTLADDDAGREDQHELLLPISIGPHGLQDLDFWLQTVSVVSARSQSCQVGDA